MKNNIIIPKKNLNSSLNLPSTWTKKKIISLFLITLLSANGTKAGQDFKNCLAHYNSSSYYKPLTEYPFNFSGLVTICCDDDKCSTNGCNSPKIANSTHDFSCFFSTNTVVCANIFCAGIPNDNKIIKNAFQGGHCKKDTNFLSTLESYISTARLDGLDYGYASLTCSSNDTCGSLEHCSWDNGGWSCYAWYANCDAQIMAPWPSSDTNSLKTTTSLINSPTTSPNLTPPPNAPNLPKIIIPVGVGTGVAVIVVGGATYYVIRKRKNKTLRVAGNTEQEVTNNQNEPAISEVIASTSQSKELPTLPIQGLNFQTTEEREVNNEVVQQENRSQIQVPPKQKCWIM